MTEICAGCEGDKTCQIQDDIKSYKYDCLIPEKFKELKDKAEKFDRYHLHLLSLEDVGVWGAINKLDAKLEAIKGVWEKYDKILREYREIDPKGQSDYHRGHSEVTIELGKALEIQTSTDTTT